MQLSLNRDWENVTESKRLFFERKP